jgi:phosphatidate phosphatase APP1
VQVLDEDPRYVSSLHEWLRSEDELRGLIGLTRGKPKPEQMGDLTSIITIAIGSGGIASVVLNSLTTWLTQRQNRQVTVKVTTKNGASVEVTGNDRAEVEALLKKAINGVSDTE